MKMEAFKTIYQYAEPNLTIVSWFGLFGFPTYYVVWHYCFQQQYESFWIRIFCSLLFVILLIRDKLPIQFKKYLPIYYQIVVTLTLPSFFFYMLLMNHWDQVWVMSFMSAIFLHLLLVHISWVIFTETFIGIIIATFGAYINTNFQLQLHIEWSHLSIFIFIYVFGNMFYWRNQVGHETKVVIAKSFGAGIAHEMRNPLSSLLTSFDLIQSILPQLSNKKENYSLSANDISTLTEISNEALKIIQSGNETIDILLSSIDESRISRTAFRKKNIYQSVSNALDSFSYPMPNDKQLVTLKKDSDFYYFGSDTLIKYVIFNLLKNSFSHQSKSHPFAIEIRLFSDKKSNYIEFIDTGTGIYPDCLKYIFKDFYSTGSKSNHGLGLPFCQKVMLSLGGNIQCTSEFGKWTSFLLTFPKLESKIVNDIKFDIIKNKRVLFISDQDQLQKKIHQLSHKMKFRCTSLPANEKNIKEAYTCNFDLVVIDIDSILPSFTMLLEIESHIYCGDVPLVYLYDKKHFTRNNANTLPIVWMKIDHWLENAESIVSQLIFEQITYNAPLSGAISKNFHNILVVDDNESLRKLTSILLEKQGFKVVQCSNGSLAIDRLNQQHFDLILMDIEMPVMDGLETTRQIRTSQKDYANIPIIAHTGDANQATIDQIYDAGMSDYIVKRTDKSHDGFF